MKTTLIDWTDDLVELLFHYSILTGAHIAGRSEVKAKWNQVNDDFFNNELCVDIKEVHYVPGKYRKLRDKYDREKELAEKEMRRGNKSKYEGSVSNLYKNFKKAIDEEEAHEEALKNKVQYVAK